MPKAQRLAADSEAAPAAAAADCVLASFSPTSFSLASSLAFTSGRGVRNKRFPRLTYNCFVKGCTGNMQEESGNGENIGRR